MATSWAAKSDRERKQLLIILGVVLAIFAVFAIISLTSSGHAGPERGSAADRYCDTNNTDPRTTQEYNGKHYDTDCLVNYPWEK